MRKAERDLAQESAAGPRAILTKAELQCLSYSQQRVRLRHLDQVCDCPALGFHLRQDPFSPQVVVPRCRPSPSGVDLAPSGATVLISPPGAGPG